MKKGSKLIERTWYSEKRIMVPGPGHCFSQVGNKIKKMLAMGSGRMLPYSDGQIYSIGFKRSPRYCSPEPGGVEETESTGLEPQSSKPS